MAARILVADDDKHAPRLVKSALDRNGYETLVAADGMDALASIERDRPDLLLLDLNMPNMDGFETLRRLKAAPATCSIRVIIVSARDGDSDLTRAWQAGAHGYLVKPYASEDLVDMVRTVLRDLPAGARPSRLWPRRPWAV
jgi:DNA-binding response OmpR family regulator